MCILIVSTESKNACSSIIYFDVFFFNSERKRKQKSLQKQKKNKIFDV